MSPETKIKPIKVVETANLQNFLLALLDSHPLHPPTLGRLDKDGTTVVTKKGSFQAGNVYAQPGDKVVIHEI